MTAVVFTSNRDSYDGVEISNNNNICSKVPFHLPTNVVCSDLMVCKNLSTLTSIFIQSRNYGKYSHSKLNVWIAFSRVRMPSLWSLAIRNRQQWPSFCTLVTSHMNKIGLVPYISFLLVHWKFESILIVPITFSMIHFLQFISIGLVWSSNSDSKTFCCIVTGPPTAYCWMKTAFYTVWFIMPWYSVNVVHSSEFSIKWC